MGKEYFGSARQRRRPRSCFWAHHDSLGTSILQEHGVFPDIDLDSHDPEAKVSRRHARILRQNDKFMVEDLGSTNGTFVNRGRRLIPGTPHLLADGDEIIVGKTFLRFNLVD